MVGVELDESRRRRILGGVRLIDRLAQRPWRILQRLTAKSFAADGALHSIDLER